MMCETTPLSTRLVAAPLVAAPRRRLAPSAAVVIAVVAASRAVASERGAAVGLAARVPTAAANAAAAAEVSNGTEPYTEVVIPMSTFLNQSKVREFLASRGVDHRSPQAVLEQFVPRKITLQVWPSRVRGALGADAEGGYVAFNVAYDNGTTSADNQYTSSFLIVTDLYGRDVTISPTMREHRAPDDARATRLHFCGLKLRDPDTMLLAGDNGTSEMGPAYLWKWRTDEYVALMGGQTKDCHDIQWSHARDGPGARGAVWMPHDSEIVLYNAGTGDVLENYGVNAQDINHVQLIDADRTAIISARQTSDILKLDTSSGEVQWYLGGSDGEFDIYDLDGKKYPKGTIYWSGQHNAEFFGRVTNAKGKLVEEYGMFDNQYGVGSSSRVLVVQVDEDTMEANVVFEHETGEYTPEYGDNDQLPSGNLLICYWLQDLDVAAERRAGDAGGMFDVRVEELVRATHLPAWCADVQGPLCEVGTCADAFASWKIYSAERFYSQPLVWDVACSASARELAFLTVNNFRQNNADLASYAVRAVDANRTLLASGSFSFSPHWLPTRVSVALANTSAEGYVVYVTNKWDIETAAYFACTDDDDDDIVDDEASKSGSNDDDASSCSCHPHCKSKSRGGGEGDRDDDERETVGGGKKHEGGKGSADGSSDDGGTSSTAYRVWCSSHPEKCER